MNWLAHIFLSENNIDYQLGNFLSDPLKARAWQNAPEKLIKGMQTHTKIDLFTDSHELFLKSKNRLGQKGLLKSVVIDLTYDYFLSKNWDKFCNIKKDDFISQLYNNASKKALYFPQDASYHITNLINRDLLNFNDLDKLHLSLQRIDKRLSPRLKKRDTATKYFNSVIKDMNKIEKDFLEFFPLLQKHIKDDFDKNCFNHWRLF